MIIFLIMQYKMKSGMIIYTYTLIPLFLLDFPKKFPKIALFMRL